jgi:hypothetical protein
MSLSFLCLCLPPLILLINENNSELVVDKNISNTIEVGYKGLTSC